MARYLNPAKIGLLVLVDLYVEGSVSSNAILPVLSFITSHLMDHGSSTATSPQASRWNKAERTVSIVISIKDFEKLLGSYPFLMGMPGRKLWDQFLGRMWDINSLDALNEFFESLGNMMARTREERQRLAELGEPVEEETGVKLSRNSPFGTFVRRAQLEYGRLQFHDCTELWKNFVRYRQPTSRYVKQKVPGFGRMSFDNVLLLGEKDDWDPESTMELAAVAYGDMLTGDQTSTVSVSTRDIETLLEFQIEQMQKYGNRVPLEICHQFYDLLSDSYLVPSLTHYLKFLDSWRSGDYPTSFDYLYRYFDYTMQNRDRLFYQYALMNLAVLQADFGCFKEAVAAMLETVSTARENRDMTCLNFALNWLFHFGRAHPDLVRSLESDSMIRTEKNSLTFLRVRAKETGMWTLWSSVLLTEAKLTLIGGGSVSKALESMVRSSEVIVQKNMRNMFGSQMSLSAALWERMGFATISASICDVFLRCHTRHSIFDDELKMTCRLSLMLVARGKYDEGLQKLEALEENSLRSWKAGQYWHKYRGIIKIKRDLHHNNLDGAEEVLSQILQTKSDDLEPDMAFLVDVLHIDYLTRRGDLQAAFEKVETMIVKLKDEKKDIALKVKLFLLKASLLDKAGRTQRGFSITMRAATMAWRARLIPTLWHAIGALSNILVSFSEFEAAARLLTAAIPRSFECDTAGLTAQLYVYLADANMGLAGKMEPKSTKRMEYMTKAAEAVQKAFDLYSSIEDVNQQCQLMAKKAMIMKLSGDMVLAADYAAAYVALRKNAEALSLEG